MLPGVVAGFYAFDETNIDVRPLCSFAGARLVLDEAVGVDLARKRVVLGGGPLVPFDILFLDIGSTPNRSGVPGAIANATSVKPMAVFWSGSNNPATDFVKARPGQHLRRWRRGGWHGDAARFRTAIEERRSGRRLRPRRTPLYIIIRGPRHPHHLSRASAGASANSFPIAEFPVMTGRAATGVESGAFIWKVAKPGF